MSKPSIRQLKELMIQVDSGRITAEILQAFLDNQGSVFEIVPFPVKIDFNLSLDEMIALGQYDKVEGRECFSEFPSDWKGTRVENDIYLLKQRHAWVGNIDSVISSLRRDGYRPAELRELLAFGSTYQNMQKMASPQVIAALGSLNHKGKYRYVPVLKGFPGGARQLKCVVVRQQDPCFDGSAWQLAVKDP